MSEATERIGVEKFPEFVKALAYFGYGVYNSIQFSPVIGSLGVDALLTFPVKPSRYVDILTEMNPPGKLEGITGYTYLSDLRRDMVSDFSTLAGIFPDLYFDKNYRDDRDARWFAFNQKPDLSEEYAPEEFLPPPLRFNPYGLFRYALEQDMVEFPRQFEAAYDVLTSSNWRGRPVDERTHIITTSSLSNLPNFIQVTGGSEGDMAFSFLGALGFFDRQGLDPSRLAPDKPITPSIYSLSAAEVHELARLDVRYLLKNRGVNMKSTRLGSRYLGHSSHSIFRPWCSSDQEVLASLVNARSRALEN